MNTVAARTIYRLFAENLFVSAITFHGGDNVIAYCWGSNNHAITQSIANEAPDHKALHALGQTMQAEAGNEIYTASNQRIPKYDLGDMTSTVYPVGGGMEDWGYAAGWDYTADATIQSC